MPRAWLRKESDLSEVSLQEIIPISERMDVGKGSWAVPEKVRFHPGFELQQSVMGEEISNNVTSYARPYWNRTSGRIPGNYAARRGIYGQEPL